TGERTEIGKIARKTEKERETETPLLKKMKKLGKRIFFAILVVSTFNFLIGVYRGYSFDFTFLASVGLAVAAIPESLPALVTMILAMGVRDMASRKAVVRRLPAVETLGSVTTICTDKTGTLTRNKMKVVKVFAGSKEYDADVVGEVDVREVRMTLLAGYICNKAIYREEDGEYIISGDPMEIALLEVAAKAGIRERDWKTIDEIPFDPAIRFMATAVEEDGIAMVYAKGAPERIIAMCSHAMVKGKPIRIDAEYLNRVAEDFASRGMRILAFAYKPADAEGFKIKEHVSDMIFLGFQCMIDPPRKESYEAVKKCKEAGVRVVMVTGDHPATALAIARELGIEGKVLTGEDVEKMSDEEFATGIGVFARVLPEHKLRIVRALQKRKEIVAVTGDGVNDAPALKAADIGVAMGSGTEVAKEASDMVIIDDNFATIVAAIEEGRKVFKKIQKVLAWTLPTNGGEGLAIFSAFLIGLALPILPIQILWINTVTALLLGTTLVFEPANELKKPTKGELLSREIVVRIGWVSLLMVLGAYFLFFSQENDVAARTAAMNTIVFFEIFYLLSARNLDKSFFAALKRKNPAILPGILAMIVLQVIVAQTQTWLQATPLSIFTWIEILAVSSLVLILSELAKLKKF
ncbi:MAG: ATPase P, partial [Archaeoglobales archaeon]